MLPFLYSRSAASYSEVSLSLFTWTVGYDLKTSHDCTIQDPLLLATCYPIGHWPDHCHHSGKLINLTWYKKVSNYKPNGSKHLKFILQCSKMYFSTNKHWEHSKETKFSHGATYHSMLKRHVLQRITIRTCIFYKTVKLHLKHLSFQTIRNCLNTTCEPPWQ
jgi:hypothetical protein